MERWREVYERTGQRFGLLSSDSPFCERFREDEWSSFFEVEVEVSVEVSSKTNQIAVWASSRIAAKNTSS
eukprot:930850-Prorocentrum_minimum.AAC.1